MRIFAISDLHLDSSGNKPMNIFNGVWTGQKEKIISSQEKLKIKDNDVLLICGDLSWAMKLEDAKIDFEFLKNLKGIKLIVRGNHDYWWGSLTRVREALPENTFAIQNDAKRIGNFVFFGTRGWQKEEEFTKEENTKIFSREEERLKLAIADAKRLAGEGDNLVCLLHYPPFTKNKEDTNMTKLIEESGAKYCIFGHLHGQYHQNFLNFEKNGVKYFLTSCDCLNNQIVEIK